MAVAAAVHAVESAADLYEAICKTPVVMAARQRRGLLGLGKHLAGDPNAADADHVSIEAMLGCIYAGEGMPIDDRLNVLHYLYQEGLARSGPEDYKPIGANDDIGLSLALDAAGLIRVTMELAFNTASLSAATELGEEGAGGAEQVIATRLALDAHSAPTLGLFAARIAVRISVGRNLAIGPAYDGVFRASMLDLYHIVAAARADVGTEAATESDSRPNPSSLSQGFAETAERTTAIALNYPKGTPFSSLFPIAERASDTASLAAKATEACQEARMAVLP